MLATASAKQHRHADTGSCVLGSNALPASLGISQVARWATRETVLAIARFMSHSAPSFAAGAMTFVEPCKLVPVVPTRLVLR